jgi:16S rRNA (uracil1498-N3)-methyltransferase
MHIFYHKGSISNDFELNEVESHHAIKVMRSKIGDTVFVINGEGQESICELLDNHPKRCKLKVVSSTYTAPTAKKVSIAIAPTKSNDRIEWFLEKATEIGVSDFIPLICKNGERGKINFERWEKIVVSAVKQSKRKWKPIIHPAISVNELLKSPFEGEKLIAYCENLPSKKIQEYTASTSTLLLIGPEGDFTVEEISLAKSHNFTPISLGENRLRTETAGIVGATILCI